MIAWPGKDNGAVVQISDKKHKTDFCDTKPRFV